MIDERLELYAYAVSRDHRDGDNYIMLKVASKPNGTVVAEYRMGLVEAKELSQDIAVEVMATGAEGPFGMLLRTDTQ